MVGVTGASGAPLALRLLENLSDHEVHLIVSKIAREVIRLELGENVYLPCSYSYEEDDFSSPLASSSFLIDAMVVIPCSMKTLAAIAHGYASNLITRAAENALRLGKPLILVPRETPLSLMDIDNMRKVKQAGGIILPAMVAYYHKPRSVDDITNFIVGKVLDVLGIEHKLYTRWAEVKPPPS
ncbi:MAG: UbiX family flavin prenyltransferase [Anaerolineae bacterium]|nr:UbiX family flavin prenyltransferase [Anaerolineae bacterium]